MPISSINSLDELQPGDIMFGPIGGLVGLGVGLGQLALGEAFRAGKLSIRHVGIVVEAAQVPTARPGGHGPRLVQAMPRGAEEVEMNGGHWTERHAYVRLEEDYPGQAADAAAIARLMVEYKVAYSPASYLALALWKLQSKATVATTGTTQPLGPERDHGLANRLEAWISRTKRPVARPNTTGSPLRAGQTIRLPEEAICSVLADQAWTLAGKRVMRNVARQAVTPGAMVDQLWRRPGAIWGFPGDPR